MRDGVKDSYGFVARLWLVAAAFAVVTIARSIQVGIPPRDVNGEILRNRVLITVGVLCVLVVIDATRRSSKPRTPRSVIGALRDRWPWSRIWLAAAGLAAYHLVYFCYHNLKSWDVFNVNRDAMLSRWDIAVFGQSPAVLLHGLLGERLAAYVLVGVYESFGTLVMVGFVAAVVLPERMRASYVVLASLVWVWILGVGTYYLIPSLGPFHARPEDFVGLPHTIVTTTQALYMEQRAQLLAHPDLPDSFAQVSAFASLHVGVTTVFVLTLRYLGLGRLAVVGWLYLAATIVATVYLGWHFASDDLAGLAIGASAVWLGRLTVGTERPRTPARPQGAASVESA